MKKIGIGWVQKALHHRRMVGFWKIEYRWKVWDPYFSYKYKIFLKNFILHAVVSWFGRDFLISKLYQDSSENARSDQVQRRMRVIDWLKKFICGVPCSIVKTWNVCRNFCEGHGTPWNNFPDDKLCLMSVLNGLSWHGDIWAYDSVQNL